LTADRDHGHDHGRDHDRDHGHDRDRDHDRDRCASSLSVARHVPERLA